MAAHSPAAMVAAHRATGVTAAHRAMGATVVVAMGAAQTTAGLVVAVDMEAEEEEMEAMVS